MSDLQKALEVIEARANAATEGPWRDRCPMIYGAKTIGHSAVARVSEQYMNRVQRERNSEFMAHSRTDVPCLVEMVKVLSEALEFYGEGKHIARIKGEEITPDLVRTNRAEGTIEVGWRARKALTKAAEILTSV